MFKKILVPVDLGEPEMIQPAVDRALALAAASPDAELRFVNVQPRTAFAILGYAATDLEDQIRIATTHDLSVLTGKLAHPAERLSSAVRFGTIYHEILEEAAAWGADLVVICSHRPSMAAYLMGSNAQSVVRHARCSVLVVR